jgi:F0F1-type ATP synthase membrane subunit b/b'
MDNYPKAKYNILCKPGGDCLKMKKNVIALTLAGCLILGATGLLFADNISTVVTTIINKVSIMLDSTGTSNASEAEQQMSSSATDTKQRIDGMIDNANTDIEEQLEEYKNAQLNKKNQEINAIISEVQNGINQKKQEKLNHYKQQIDEKIDREYNKLINDLTK